MKITYTGCKTRDRTTVGRCKPGTVVKTLNCLPDACEKDMFLVIDMRSYGAQLDDMGCYDKIGLVNLRSNKLSIVQRSRSCTVVKNIEVCVHDD